MYYNVEVCTSLSLSLYNTFQYINIKVLNSSSEQIKKISIIPVRVDGYLTVIDYKK